MFAEHCGRKQGWARVCIGCWLGEHSPQVGDPIPLELLLFQIRVKRRFFVRIDDFPKFITEFELGSGTWFKVPERPNVVQKVFLITVLLR